MGQYHEVVQGECLANISLHYGFRSYKSIYDAPENADFRRKRPNPNIMYPGDQLYIPEKEQRNETRPTGASHPFRVSREKVLLRIVLMGDGGAPQADKKFELTAGDAVTGGRTGSDGLIETEIPADTLQGALKAWLGKDESDGAVVWNLQIGHLDPADTVTGGQARLNNLGFYCGAVDGIVGPKTENALKAFQIKNGIPVSGSLDQATLDLLAGEHDFGN